MKEIRPNLKWMRTPSGWNLQIRVSLPKGYELAISKAHSQLTDRKRLSLELVPSPKSKGGTQEVLIPFPELPTTDLTVDLADTNGKRVGGGKVVVFEDVDEK